MFTEPHRVQCEGFPCKRCSKAGRICTFHEPGQTGIRLGGFGRSGFKTGSSNAVAFPAHPSHISRLMLPDQHCSLLTHFYVSFLSLNSFTGRSDGFQSVHALLRDSPTLFNAAIAVSALHVRGQDSALRLPRTNVALRSYMAAVCGLRRNLDDRDQRLDDSTLWSTFFLGIFEVHFST